MPPKSISAPQEVSTSVNRKDSKGATSDGSEGQRSEGAAAAVSSESVPPSSVSPSSVPKASGSRRLSASIPDATAISVSSTNEARRFERSCELHRKHTTVSGRSDEAVRQWVEGHCGVVAACCRSVALRSWCLSREANAQQSDAKGVAQLGVLAVRDAFRGILSYGDVHALGKGESTSRDAADPSPEFKDTQRVAFVNEMSLDKKLREGAARIVEAYATELIVLAQQSDDRGVITSPSSSRSKGYFSTLIESAEATVAGEAVEGQSVLLTLWTERGAAKLFQKANMWIGQHIRGLLLPPVFTSLPTTTVAYDGFLFTVTWLIPFLCSAPLPTRSQLVDPATQLLSCSLLSRRNPVYSAGSSVPAAVDVFPTSISTYCLLPSSSFLEFLQKEICSPSSSNSLKRSPFTTRLEFSLVDVVGELSEQQEPQGDRKGAIQQRPYSAHHTRLVEALLRMILSKSSVLSTIPVTTRGSFLSSMFHFHGVAMRDLLEVRSLLVTKDIHDASLGGDQVRRVRGELLQLMASEAVARSLKSLILTQREPMRSFLREHQVHHAMLEEDIDRYDIAMITNAAVDLLGSSASFISQLVEPLLREKFLCSRDVSIVIKRDMSMADVVCSLRHLFGLSELFSLQKRTVAPTGEQTPRGQTAAAKKALSMPSVGSPSVHSSFLWYGIGLQWNAVTAISFAELGQALTSTVHDVFLPREGMISPAAVTPQPQSASHHHQGSSPSPSRGNKLPLHDSPSRQSAKTETISPLLASACLLQALSLTLVASAMQVPSGKGSRDFCLRVQKLRVVQDSLSPLFSITVATMKSVMAALDASSSGSSKSVELSEASQFLQSKMGGASPATDIFTLLVSVEEIRFLALCKQGSSQGGALEFEWGAQVDFLWLSQVCATFLKLHFRSVWGPSVAAEPQDASAVPSDGKAVVSVIHLWAAMIANSAVASEDAGSPPAGSSPRKKPIPRKGGGPKARDATAGFPNTNLAEDALAVDVMNVCMALSAEDAMLYIEVVQQISADGKCNSPRDSLLWIGSVATLLPQGTEANEKMPSLSVGGANTKGNKGQTAKQQPSGVSASSASSVPSRLSAQKLCAALLVAIVSLPPTLPPSMSTDLIRGVAALHCAVGFFASASFSETDLRFLGWCGHQAAVLLGADSSIAHALILIASTDTPFAMNGDVSLRILRRCCRRNLLKALSVLSSLSAAEVQQCQIAKRSGRGGELEATVVDFLSDVSNRVAEKIRSLVLGRPELLLSALPNITRSQVLTLENIAAPSNSMHADKSEEETLNRRVWFIGSGGENSRRVDALPLLTSARLHLLQGSGAARELLRCSIDKVKKAWNKSLMPPEGSKGHLEVLCSAACEQWYRQNEGASTREELPTPHPHHLPLLHHPSPPKHHDNKEDDPPATGRYQMYLSNQARRLQKVLEAMDVDHRLKIRKVPLPPSARAPGPLRPDGKEKEKEDVEGGSPKQELTTQGQAVPSGAESSTPRQRGEKLHTKASKATPSRSGNTNQRTVDSSSDDVVVRRMEKLTNQEQSKRLFLIQQWEAEMRQSKTTFERLVAVRRDVERTEMGQHAAVADTRRRSSVNVSLLDTM